MAIINPTITRVVGEEAGDLFLATWVLTTADTTGLAIEMPAWPDRTISMKGTIGAAVMSWEGSNTNVDADFATLSNAAGGTALTMAAVPQCKAVIENPRFQRPKLTTPGAGATLTVTVLCRRATPMRA